MFCEMDCSIDATKTHISSDETRNNGNFKSNGTTSTDPDSQFHQLEINSCLTDIPYSQNIYTSLDPGSMAPCFVESELEVTSDNLFEHISNLEEVDEISDMELHLECSEDGHYVINKNKTCVTGNNVNLHFTFSPRKEKKESLYACQLCNVKFTMETKFCQHVKNMHGVSKPFQCTICKHETLSKRLLWKHISRKHKGTEIKTFVFSTKQGGNKKKDLSGNCISPEPLPLVFENGTCKHSDTDLEYVPGSGNQLEVKSSGVNGKNIHISEDMKNGPKNHENNKLHDTDYCNCHEIPKEKRLEPFYILSNNSKEIKTQKENGQEKENVVDPYASEDTLSLSPQQNNLTESTPVNSHQNDLTPNQLQHHNLLKQFRCSQSPENYISKENISHQSTLKNISSNATSSQALSRDVLQTYNSDQFLSLVKPYDQLSAKLRKGTISDNFLSNTNSTDSGELDKKFANQAQSRIDETETSKPLGAKQPIKLDLNENAATSMVTYTEKLISTHTQGCENFVHKLQRAKKITQHNMYYCSQCEYFCRQRRSLVYHWKCHEGKTDFPCDVCPKQFVTRTALKRHMITHREVRNFICKYEGCSKQFKHVGALTDHIKVVHQKEKKCCKKSSKTILVKDKHSVSHTCDKYEEISPEKCHSNKFITTKNVPCVTCRETHINECNSDLQQKSQIADDTVNCGSSENIIHGRNSDDNVCCKTVDDTGFFRGACSGVLCRNAEKIIECRSINMCRNFKDMSEQSSCPIAYDKHFSESDGVAERVAVTVDHDNDKDVDDLQNVTTVVNFELEETNPNKSHYVKGTNFYNTCIPVFPAMKRYDPQRELNNENNHLSDVDKLKNIEINIAGYSKNHEEREDRCNNFSKKTQKNSIQCNNSIRDGCISTRNTEEEECIRPKTGIYVQDASKHKHNDLLDGTSITKINKWDDTHKKSNSKKKRYRCCWSQCGKMFRDNYNLSKHYATHTGEKSLKCELCNFTCIQKTSLDHHRSSKHKGSSSCQMITPVNI